MEVLMIFIRLSLLLISLYGYAGYLHNRRHMKAEFIPATLFSMIGCCVFFAGLLNILETASALILVTGLVFFVRNRKERQPIFLIRSWGIILSVFLCVVFFSLTYQNKFLDYDDFSHWGMVVRGIVEDNAFPNFESINIRYQSYPTGSASFVYFFAQIVGVKSEWFLIHTQQILITAMLCCLFVFCRPKNILENLFAVTVIVVMILSVNDVISTICVDTLLASVGAAGFTVCVFYRNEIEKARIAIAPIAVFLITIKNSGMFFAVSILLYYFYRAVRTKKHICAEDLLLFSAPFFTFYLWDRHVDMVYSSAMNAKHSMSMENYSYNLGKKSMEDIAEIVQSIGDNIFSNTNLFWLLFLLAVILLGIGMLRKKEVNFLTELLTVVAFCYLVYQVGMCCMYILSMPLGEALTLAGYDRYHETILLFLCGIVFAMGIVVLRDSLKEENWKSVSCFILSAALFVGAYGTILRPRFTWKVYEGSDRQRLDQIVEKYNLDVTGSTSYIIYWQEYRSFLHHVGKYVLNPYRYASSGTSDFIDTVDEIDNYDYMIVVDHTEEIDRYLMDTFGTAAEDVYRIDP